MWRGGTALHGAAAPVPCRPLQDAQRLVCHANRSAWRLGERNARNRKKTGGYFLEDRTSLWGDSSGNSSGGSSSSGCSGPVVQWLHPSWPNECWPEGQKIAFGVDPAELLRLVEQYRRMPPPPKVKPKQRLRPNALPDAVKPGMVQDVQGALPGKPGVVVEAVAVPTVPNPIPLPKLTSDRRATIIHVFWDMDSATPGDADPRVACAQLRKVLGNYGQLAGIYAYGVRKDFTWVPDAFLRRYGTRQQQLKQHKQQLTQQQRWQRPAVATGQQGAPSGTSSSLEQHSPSQHTLRCPACGALVRSYASLQQHMVQLHKIRAPPPSKLLAPQQQQGQQGLAKQSPVPSASHARSIGKVKAYYNSYGQLYVPAPGHQMTLKYVLLREGVEVRLVQNAREARLDSLAAGVETLLGELRLRGRAEVGAVREAVAVVASAEGVAAALQEARKLGVATIGVAVGAGGAKARGGHGSGGSGVKSADVLLDWQAVVQGGYQIAVAASDSSASSHSTDGNSSSSVTNDSNSNDGGTNSSSNSSSSGANTSATAIQPGRSQRTRPRAQAVGVAREVSRPGVMADAHASSSASDQAVGKGAGRPKRHNPTHGGDANHGGSEHSGGQGAGVSSGLVAGRGRGAGGGARGRQHKRLFADDVV